MSQGLNMEEILENSNKQINELIKFAEAKNAVLITFNGLAILEIVKNINDKFQSFPAWVLAVLFYMLLMNIISFLVCLHSIFPSIQSTVHNPGYKNNANLLFFGTMATMTAEEYYEAFITKYKIQPVSRELSLDLITQNIIQSQILLKKFNDFKSASIFTFCAYASPFGYYIYRRFYYKDKGD